MDWPVLLWNINEVYVHFPIVWLSKEYLLAVIKSECIEA